jgi:hypothetical protein
VEHRGLDSTRATVPPVAEADGQVRNRGAHLTVFGATPAANAALVSAGGELRLARQAGLIFACESRKSGALGRGIG